MSLKSYGIKPNYEKIGEGVYDMLVDEDKAVIAHGMLPLHVAVMLENSFRRRIAKVQMKAWREKEDDEELKSILAKNVKTEIVNEFMKDIHVAILRVAQKNNALLV